MKYIGLVTVIIIPVMISCLMIYLIKYIADNNYFMSFDYNNTIETNNYSFIKKHEGKIY